MNTAQAQRNVDLRVREALEIDCFSYLQSKGISPIRESGSYYYYKSPIHGGNRGSLIVNKNNNRWIDYRGDGKWDRVVSLVMKVEGADFVESVNILLGDSGHIKSFTPPDDVDPTPGIKLVQRKNWLGKELFAYLRFRKVNRKIAKLYCKQVTVVFPRSEGPNKKVDFIGFQNNIGGWELRNWYGKRSVSPKYFTTIGNEGDKYIFEGFMDYLSYLTHYKIERIDGVAIILNSLAILSWVTHLLELPGTNFLFFDNDETAEQKISFLKEKKIPFVDNRGFYKLFNDINDMLQNNIRF